MKKRRVKMEKYILIRSKLTKLENKASGHVSHRSTLSSTESIAMSYGEQPAGIHLFDSKLKRKVDNISKCSSQKSSSQSILSLGTSSKRELRTFVRRSYISSLQGLVISRITHLIIS